MSLLLSEGHKEPGKYPIAKLWSEARIVRQRRAKRLVEEAGIMQMVVASVMSDKAGKRLQNMLKGIDESD